MYASESYSWLVFALLVASAIFLAVFVVLQWVKDAPKGRRVASVLQLYTLLYVLLLLVSLPFDSGLLAPIAVILGSGVGLGVMAGGVFSLVRGIIRWIGRPRAEEERGLAEEPKSQSAEAKGHSRIRVRDEGGKRPSRRIWRKVRDVVLAHVARFYLFWRRERLRAEKRRRAKEQLRAQRRQLAEEQRRANEQRRSEKRRREQEEAIKSFLELMRGGENRLERRSRSIPQAVKIAVLTRDGGKCRRCGSTRDLQYDRIVPNSRGGSSTDVNNIRLLCGKCSNLKSNRNIA
jgi:hypothetical protein